MRCVFENKKPCFPGSFSLNPKQETGSMGIHVQSEAASSQSPEDDRGGGFGRAGIAAVCKAVALGHAHYFSGLSNEFCLFFPCFFPLIIPWNLGSVF